MPKLYHITHIKNLQSILKEGGLWSDSEREARKMLTESIAHQHIKNRRKRRMVDKAARGFLSDYVPFYFAPRAPMLYSIHHGYVEGYEGGQASILHLVTSIETVTDLCESWCYTDGHAEMYLSKFYDSLDDLNQAVDWNVMRSQYWNDTDEYPDRKRRRQAEFLVHRFFPWSAMLGIGVYNQEMKEKVEQLARDADLEVTCLVKREWYYGG